jgi:DNA-3-methyladenine glycosylase I
VKLHLFGEWPMKKSCEWPGENKLMIKYHDTEWGVPTHDDRKLFELLMLDNAQAGLSWQTVLNKRENYRKAFDNFEPAKIARYNERKITSLLNNAGIIRNRLKVESAVTNARAVLEIQKEFGSFDSYIWQFVNGTTIRNKWKTLKEIPPTSPESDAMSKALKKRGFKFVGSTICYAFMQSIGMVNDHLIYCFRYTQCG